MRLFQSVLLISTVCQWVQCHGNSDPNPDLAYLNKENSLVDLVHQTHESINQDWIINENVKFEEGRFILTPKPEVTSSDDLMKNVIGSIWTGNSVTFKPSTGFTFETTLRSIGAIGKTGAGLSYWFIRDSDQSLTNFGGPSVFDGLQILFNGESITSYLNDGSKKFEDLKPFSTCYLAYQDSDVPITLRVSYSDKDYFKLTLNNYLCFETQLIKFDDLKNFNIGITASSPNDLTKFEQFELFKFETYKKVTEEAQRSTKGTLASHPKVVTKIITTDISLPTSQQLLFREKEAKLRESINTPTDSSDLINKVELSNLEVLNKLDSLQSLFANINTKGSKSNSKLDNDFIIQSSNHHGELKTLISENNALLKDLSKQNTESTQLLSDLILVLQQRIVSLEDQLSTTNKLVELISGKIGSLSHDSHFNSIIAKLDEVDLNQKSSVGLIGKDSTIVSLQTKIKWIIIMIFMFFIGIGYSVFKLRGEIKHGKIL